MIVPLRGRLDGRKYVTSVVAGIAFIHRIDSRILLMKRYGARIMRPDASQNSAG